MFREDSRPSTGRGHGANNRNRDTSLWSDMSSATNTAGGATSSRGKSVYQPTSLWATPDELAQTSARNGNRNVRAPTPRTSLWGTIDPKENTVGKQQPVRQAAPFATDDSTMSTMSSAPPPPRQPSPQPFATDADAPSAESVQAAAAEQFRQTLTYDLEERYRQTADAFVAADVDRSGFLDETEILRLCHLFNLPEKHVAAVYNSCDNNKDGKLDYREFAYYLVRPSFGNTGTEQQQSQQQSQQGGAVSSATPAAVPAVMAEPELVAVAAPPPAPTPNTARPDPRFASNGVSLIFGGPDGAPTPPAKFTKGRSKNRNYAPTSLW